MMNRIFISIMFLSIAGSFCSFLFVMMEKYIYFFTSAKTTSFINSIVLCMFIVPLYKIHSWYDNSEFLYAHYDFIVPIQHGNPINEIYQNIQSLSKFHYFMYIWLIGAILYISISIIIQLFILLEIKRNHFTIPHENWTRVWHALCEQHNQCHYIQQTELVSSRLFSQPCTTGFRKKYIIIPAKMLNLFHETEIEFILGHELMHIKRKDNLLKLLMIVLNAFHWFHPFFYIVKRSLYHWIEVECDEELIASFSKEKKKEYKNLMFKILLEEFDAMPQQCLSYFSGRDKTTLKRRIYAIMKTKSKVGVMGKIFATTCVGVMVLGGSALAKNLDGPVNMLFSDKVDFVEEENLTVYLEGEKIESDTLQYHDFDSQKFISEIIAGEVAPINLEESAQYYAIFENGTIEEITNSNNGVRHSHNPVPATIKKHIKNKDGSCKTTYYDGAKCSCGQIWKYSIIDEETHKVCPH